MEKIIFYFGSNLGDLRSWTQKLGQHIAPTVFNPLKKALEKALLALHPSRKQILLSSGWECGTHSFETLLEGVEEVTYEPLDKEEIKIPDIVLIEGHSLDAHKADHILPIASCELKGPLRRPGLLGEADEDFVEVAITNILQNIFDGKLRDSKGFGETIAQDMVEVLLTYSGCTILYCHTWSRSIFISDLTPEKITLKISRAFFCNEDLSSLLATLALLDFALRYVDPAFRKSTANMDKLQTLYKSAQRVGTMNANSMNNNAQTSRSIARRNSGTQTGGSSMNVLDGRMAQYQAEELLEEVLEVAFEAKMAAVEPSEVIRRLKDVVKTRKIWIFLEV